MSKFTKPAGACFLMLALCLTLGSSAFGQWAGGGYGRGQGRREGGIVLPTPPFNPDAGILRGRKGRARGGPGPAPRRAVVRRAGAGKRSRRPVTPRVRRVSRGRHRR